MKLSDLSDQEWFNRLQRKRDLKAATIAAWWQYYDGDQPLYWIAKLLAEQDDRFPALTVNWCEKFIDSIDRRTITEGFRVAGEDQFDEDLWAAWKRNGMRTFESENTIASLVTDSSYIFVGPDDGGGALITVEAPGQVAVQLDPRTRKPVAAAKFYKSDPDLAADDLAVLQVANGDGTSRMIDFELGKPADAKTLKWMAGGARPQLSPEIPVVPYVNRQRQGVGRSELRALRPVVDAANLIATQMMATSHHHAMPRMLAINVAESMFLNDDGSINKDAVKQATGALWVVPAEVDDQGRTIPKADAPEVDIKQLPASDMRNFHESMNLLGRIGAGLCDLPPSSFGFGVADNGTSADSIRAAKEDLITRIERVHMSQDDGHTRVAQLVAAVEGRDPKRYEQVESIRRDASKPTKAAMADSAVKALGSGISDLYQARVDYGYSAQTIEDMEAREREAQRLGDESFANAIRPPAPPGGAEE